MSSPSPRARTRRALALVAVALAVVATLAFARRARAPHLVGLAAAAATGLDTRRRPNRLIKEKSPYLLQHAYNPVDWYPWGDEAFAKARRENKPIFLSIGYSTCHWCHVMERESFENDSVAALLNASFVAIKVDREERPDVDRVYMSAMQAMGMGGGWPLNVFLTPDLHPFFGGTYFPPRTMLEMLPRVHEAWTSQRDQIQKTGVEVMAALAGMNEPDSTGAKRERLLADAYQSLERSYDAEQGGFGGAPKFPSTVNLNFLLRVWARDPKGRARAREMVLRQLDRMQAGGIHDQLGGGFHRYATDRVWLVPHFEKMLYDQAQLAWAYLEGYQVTGDRRYAETARGIFTYVMRDLADPSGGFDSAEDADSEGEEGKFYVWTPAEIEAVLDPEDARLFERRYGVTAAGNFEGGGSILHEAVPVVALAAETKRPVEEVEASLAAARAKLLAARARRVRPHRDDKVLTAWNGLMISALSRGARVLDEPALAARAARAADYVWKELRDPATGELRRGGRAGEAFGRGQLDDYAYYALGLVDLYAATLDPRWLERAVAVTEQQIERFWDEADGGFFESPAGDASIQVRLKDGYDGAEIAGNSIAAWTLEVLANLLDREPWRDKARRTLDYFASRIASHPVAMPQMLVAMDLAAAAPRHVVIAGRPDAADTRALIAEFNRRFLPHDLLLLADGGASQQRLEALAPFTAPLRAQNGHATAYVCEHYACKLPTTDRQAFATALEAHGAEHR